jgi:hypothetical protein
MRIRLNFITPLLVAGAVAAAIAATPTASSQPACVTAGGDDAQRKCSVLLGETAHR